MDSLQCPACDWSIVAGSEMGAGLLYSLHWRTEQEAERRAMDQGVHAIVIGDVVIIDGEEPREYACLDCGQLRLSLRGEPEVCGNCDSANIQTGAPGTLERPEVRR